MTDKKIAAREAIPDRDAQALTVVTALAVLIVGGAVVWSAVAIGGLLALAFPVWISYGIAAVFDLMWIGLMILEWTTRYDSERVALPRRAGWAALVLSMTLITAHGGAQGYLWIGLAGAAVSLLAKSYWHIVMKTTGAKLAPDAAKSVKERRDAVHADLALIAVNRQLTRLTAKADAEKRALGIGSVRLTPGEPVSRPAHVVEQIGEPVEPTGSPAQLSSAQRLREDRLRRLTRLIADEPELTPAQAAQRLDVSLATAKRDLKAVRVRS
ncbi:hypothetical protein OG742_11345 [Streptomyces sp. NBC_00828]|uniref:hypothetical protein n=1 Tax=Streptomyces sp. NBC_00828 TaxID=2903678 RepID=UPI00386ABEE0